MDITSEHMKNFSKNGAVLLKGAFSEFVEDAQTAIEENIENPSWRERTYTVSYTHLTLPTTPYV